MYGINPDWLTVQGFVFGFFPPLVTIEGIIFSNSWATNPVCVKSGVFFQLKSLTLTCCINSKPFLFSLIFSF